MPEASAERCIFATGAVLRAIFSRFSDPWIFMDSHGNSKIKVTTVISVTEADFCSDSEEFRVITARVFKSHLESKNQKGTLSVPTFLSPHVSQFPRFHMSGQTTWQITYESLLGKMLRLRNSCLWICSVTNKQTWGTPDSDYISNSQERKSHTENKRKKNIGLAPPTSPKTAYRANPDIFFLVVELLTFVFCSCSCFLLFFLFLWISHMLTWCVLIICFEECLQTQRTGV